MKKNLADILRYADTQDLDGMFDTVGNKTVNIGKIKKKVITKKSQSGYTGTKSDGTVFWPVIAALLIALIAAIFVPALVKPDAPEPAVGITDLQTGSSVSCGDTGAVDSDSADNVEIIETRRVYLKDKVFFGRIIWSELESDELSADLDGAEFKKWNGLTVTDSFFSVLESSPGDALFAVKVKTTTPGLGFEEYLRSYQPEYLPVYEEQMLNAEKWIELQNWYSVTAYDIGNTAAVENTKNSIIEKFGEDFFNTYYHDGDYDYDLMKEDIKRYELLVNDVGSNKLKEPNDKYTLQIRPDIRYISNLAGETVPYYTYFLNNKYDYLIIISKSDLACLYGLAEKNGSLSRFDFEHSCFSMIRYPASVIDDIFIVYKISDMDCVYPIIEKIRRPITERKDFDSIIWSDSESDRLDAPLKNAKTVKWNGITVTENFRDALESSTNKTVFAVILKYSEGSGKENDETDYPDTKIIQTLLGFKIPIYSIRDAETDHHYKIALLTKAMLSDLYVIAEYRGTLAESDEHYCFCMVNCDVENTDILATGGSGNIYF